METYAKESLDTQYELHPTGDRIIVRRAPKKETAMGLILPEDMKGKNVSEGEVIAVGPGAIVNGDAETRHSLQVKKGDKVLYGKHSGAEIEVNGEKLTVMHELEVLVILR